MVHITIAPGRAPDVRRGGRAGSRRPAGWLARVGVSPEQSLLLHAGDRTAPNQLLVRAPRGRNRVTPLFHGTSLLEVRAAMTSQRELFAASVAASLVRDADLAGYRDASVYIQRSMHVSPSPAAVRDAMPALFELLREEPDPAVRGS